MPFQFLKPAAEGGLLGCRQYWRWWEPDYSAGNCSFDTGAIYL